jgi:hypothetical protein
MFEDGRREEPMALTQLILLYHLLAVRNGQRPLASTAR